MPETEHSKYTLELSLVRGRSRALEAGWGGGKEGELATTSVEPEYQHPKSRCEVLAGEDDVSNDVITLGTCFSMFVYIRVLSTSR